jgi:hypothetical protein
MPCLRIYSPYVPPAQKHLIAQNLIDITSRTFDLKAEDRHSVDVQFVLVPRVSTVTGLQPSLARGVDVFLELSDGGLTEEKRIAFAEEATPMLTRVLVDKPKTWLSRLTGRSAGGSRRVALLFDETAPTKSSRADETFHDFERRAV